MTKILVILLFLGSFSHSIAQTNEDSLRSELVAYANTCLGVKYQYGGTSSKGFDCSGLLYNVYRFYHLTVPRSSSGYENYGKKTKVTDAKPGDVIVFTGSNSAIRKPGHVGIIISNDAGNIVFIHASSSKKHAGVIQTNLNESHYQKRFLYIKNIINE